MPHLRLDPAIARVYALVVTPGGRQGTRRGSTTRIIEEHLPEIIALCRRHHVRRLALFGSATGDRFDPTGSDFDFLVEFEPLAPVDHADGYFGLLHGPEDLFGRPIDLLERRPIRNPYLLAAIEESEVLLYEAA